MGLPQSSRLQFTQDLTICRILNGLWQVSGGHGRINPQAAVREMFDYHETGFTSWDLADHYGPAEDFIGDFRRQLAKSRGTEALPSIQAFTKWVPRPGRMTREVVEHNIDISLRRMDVETLDLLQFHWWDYSDKRYLDALKHLSDLKEEGKIRHLALTNFDTEHLRIITEHDITIVSNQVQFSLIDRRPEIEMIPFCQAHDIQLLTYGTVCGGLLSEQFLGRREPGQWSLKTASLQKYKQMVDAWGGWQLFQELLGCLKDIAEKHAVSIANIATYYILTKPCVAGVILGTRLGVSEHRADNARVFDMTLDAGELDQMHSLLSHSNNLFQSIGDCGDEYRN